MILFEIGHYWLLALALAVLSIGVWLYWTAFSQDKPARAGGILLLVAAVIPLGIFLCAIHGTYRG